MSQIASFYLLKVRSAAGTVQRQLPPARSTWPSGTGVSTELDLDVRFPAPQMEDTLDCALLEGELASKPAGQLCGSRTSRNWPLKLPWTGTCLPRRYKADWERCAPILSRCRATLPCCMKCYKTEGYHASRPTTAAEDHHRRPPLFQHGRFL